MAAQSKYPQLFSRGLYKEVVELWEEEGLAKGDQLSGTLLVGALCFLGRQWEAEEIPLEQSIPEGRNFFIGIAQTRESKYEEANKSFAKNLRLHKKKSDNLTNFFIWQGHGFFQFFTGQTFDLLESSEKAYRAALRAKFVWGQVMALDLVAHGLFLRGRVQESISTFDQVIEKALKMKAPSLASSYQVSRACYLSQVSADPIQSISDLWSVEKNLSAQDKFSRVTIQLEVFRQLIHAGKFDEARELFALESPNFYKAKNRRQIATLLHRYSFLLSLQGAYVEALAVLRAARMNLIEDVDRLQLLRSYGLEKKILHDGKLSESASSSELKMNFEKLDSQIASFVGQRIQKRISGSTSLNFSRGQDALGDILDLAKTNPESAIESMVKHKLWGLLPSTMGWSPLKNRIVLDVSSGHALIYWNCKCFLSARPIKGYPRKVLEVLRSSGIISKSIIIQQVWGYKYDSIRHDSLLHSNLHQLRVQMGGDIPFLEANHEGYFLKVSVFDLKRSREEFSEEGQFFPQIEASRATYSIPTELKNLNARQIRLLRAWEPGSSIDIRTYCQQFAVSHMTAFRDLSQLAKESHFQRVGKGRATCYIRV
jgi:hypothetical protein